MNINTAPFKSEPMSLELLAYRYLAAKFETGQRVKYGCAREILGRMLHLKKSEARRLIFQMSRTDPPLIDCGNRGLLLLPINGKEAES